MPELSGTASTLHWTGPAKDMPLKISHTLAPATLLATALLAGCTAVQVSPLQVAPNHICIEENPKVLVRDFVPVLRAGFTRHGIDTSVHARPERASCAYILSYSARRSWDLAPYLSQAELRIVGPNRREVARADYHLRNKGGLSLLKWQGTKAKMDPVIDQLLAQVGNLPRNAAASTPQTATASTPAATATPTIDEQLDALAGEQLSYEEYQRRYQAIMQDAR